MEVGAKKELFSNPAHPYTYLLLDSILHPDPRKRKERILSRGEIPSPVNPPKGCRFHTRCPRKIGAICEDEVPPWRDDGDGHYIRCHIELDELIELQTAPNPHPEDA
jgi:peptide/nickel transport system ATP-binding protein